MLAVGAAAAGAVTDVRSGHIPNRLTLGALAVAPLLWFGVTASSQGMTAGAAGARHELCSARACVPSVPRFSSFAVVSAAGT